MIEVEAFYDEPTGTLSYLVWDQSTLDAAIIDPVLDYEPNAARLSTESADRIFEASRSRDLNLKWILDTHVHADHLTAADYLRAKTGAKVGIGANVPTIQKHFATFYNETGIATDGRQFDALFNDGETFSLGSLAVKVLSTPGHTPACISYLIDDAIFVGDTLFMPDYGTARTDFPGGDAATLYQSIRKILDLPATTRVFVGHDYPSGIRDEAAWEATVDEHRNKNVHVHNDITKEDFVRTRTSRDADLAAPRLILPSLQVNIRGGALPDPENDGNVYLKIPVDRL